MHKSETQIVYESSQTSWRRMINESQPKYRRVINEWSEKLDPENEIVCWRNELKRNLKLRETNELWCKRIKKLLKRKYYEVFFT